MYRGIEQHYSGQLGTVIECPAQGHRSSPVMRHGDYWPSEVKSFGQMAEIDDSVSKSPGNPGVLGVTHLKLIDRYDSHVRRSLGDELSPQK